MNLTGFSVDKDVCTETPMRAEQSRKKKKKKAVVDSISGTEIIDLVDLIASS